MRPFTNIKKTFRCSGLLTKNGWTTPAFVSIDAEGVIVEITNEVKNRDFEILDAFLIPGFINAHSHAFQYAMAGMTERLSPGRGDDDFWSWREVMYNVALKITPEQQESIATMLYSEMLRQGYTSVAEFHYLHHDQNGKPYSQLDQMSERLMVAAKATGIQLTIIPIFYQQGGFRKPAKPEQRRFLSSTTDNYLNLLNTVVKTAQKYKDVKVALGVHSLRAVNTEDILSTLKSHVDLPVHIHVAEQLQEVEDCQKYLQNRPVEWLLKNVPLNSRFNLIHATHMTTDETAQLAKSGANVVLCPSTEANLGDGFFQLETFLKNNGSIAIGSDSHIGLSPLEELRWLDYGLRLQKQKRNPLCKITATQEINSGSILLSSVWEGGKKSIGCISTDQDFFTPGSFFDAVCLDPSHPLLAGKPLRSLVPATIFGGDSTLFAGVMRRGQRLVKDGCHESREQIRASYKETILQLFE